MIGEKWILDDDIFANEWRMMTTPTPEDNTNRTMVTCLLRLFVVFSFRFILPLSSFLLLLLRLFLMSS